MHNGFLIFKGICNMKRIIKYKMFAGHQTDIMHIVRHKPAAVVRIRIIMFTPQTATRPVRFVFADMFLLRHDDYSFLN
jgi:hypothetical protein